MVDVKSALTSPAMVMKICVPKLSDGDKVWNLDFFSQGRLAVK